jgi:Domain of unknown function (DUF4148)
MNTIRKATFALALAPAAGGALSQGTLTREQMQAELDEAIRTGDIVVNGETGLKTNELWLGFYPVQSRGRDVPTQATAARTEMPPAR